jgi:hypothetical protein
MNPNVIVRPLDQYWTSGRMITFGFCTELVPVHLEGDARVDKAHYLSSIEHQISAEPT